MTYFTADTHVNHNREFIYEQRGFNNIQEHDVALFTEFSKLTDKDTLYIVGDVSCGRYSLESAIVFLNSLKCKTIIVKGNHDDGLFQNRSRLRFNINLIDSVYLDIKIDKCKITLCHYPMVSWNASHWNSWFLYGHVHNKPIPITGKMFDVALTKEHFSPYSINEIKEIMNELPNNWDYIERENIK